MAMSGADSRLVVESVTGPARADDITTNLRGLVETWMDTQQLRKSIEQRSIGVAYEVRKAEARYADQVKKMLRAHPLWPWLEQYPGLGGVQTARLISRIGDPRRFPGQHCANPQRHYFPPVYAVGDPCPAETHKGPCGYLMLPPRTTTGVRSVWHFCGLHVDEDGRSPRKRRDHQADWDPIARTAVLQPDGIADQIVKQRVPKYRDIYDKQKERLTRERGAVKDCEIECAAGLAEIGHEGEIPGGEAGQRFAIDTTSGLRPIQIHKLAQKIAAKAFVGDLLVEWKRIAT